MSIPNQDTKQYSNPNNTDGSEPTNPAPANIHDGSEPTNPAPTGNNTKTNTTSSGNSGTGGILARTALLGITLITGIFILANLTTWAISQTLNNINLPIANYHILSLTYSAAILTTTIAVAYPITRKLGTTIPTFLLANSTPTKPTNTSPQAPSEPPPSPPSTSSPPPPSPDAPKQPGQHPTKS